MGKVFFFYIAILFFCLVGSLRGFSACGDNVIQFTTSINSADSCLGVTPVSLSNTSTGSDVGFAVFIWYVNDVVHEATIGTIASPSDYVINAPGTYDFKLVVDFGACKDSFELTVDKFLPPVANFNFVTGGTLGCSPHETALTNTTTGNPSIFAWYVDGNLEEVNTTTYDSIWTVAPGVSETHQVRLFARNKCGEDDTIVDIVTENGFTIVSPPSPLICEGGSIPFEAFSVRPGAAVYNWVFSGLPATAVGAGPHSITYATAGDYNDSLFVENASGACKDTVILDVTVNAPVIPSFTPSAINVCGEDTVIFTNTSPPATLYVWDFGAGADPNGINTGSTDPIKVVYATSGTKNINLTAQNGACSRFVSMNIFVRDIPVVDFSAPSTVGCSPYDVSFTNNVPNNAGDTYLWDFGNGNTSADHTPLAPETFLSTANDDSTYSVSLEVTNLYGCKDSSELSITALLSPVADILEDTISGCEDLSVVFTNNSLIGPSISGWTFAGGAIPATSALPNPGTIVFPNTGFHEAIYTATNGGICVDKDTTIVEVFELPDMTFTVPPDTQGCSPLDLTFNYTGPVVGNSFLWDFENGVTKTISGPIDTTFLATWPNNSIYNIELLIETDDGCKDSVTRVITVNPLPVIDIGVSEDTVCVGEVVNFLNNTGVPTNFWDFGDGSSSTAIAPTHAYVTPGIDTVIYIGTSVNNCQDRDSLIMVVDTLPGADFTFSTECAGDSTVFTNTSTGSPTAYLWDFDDGDNANTTDPKHLFLAAGNYDVSLTATNLAGCSHTQTRNVPVNVTPEAMFSSPRTCFGETSSFEDASSGNPDNWQWDFGDGGTSSQQDTNYTYAAHGDYMVQLIATVVATGCTDTLNQLVTVDSVPEAGFDFLSVCANDMAQFTDTSKGSPDTYTWDFGDGNMDNTNNPTPINTYANGGVYTVELIAGYAATGCTDTVERAIDIFSRSVPSFVSNSPCLNDTVFFTGTTTGEPPVSWLWKFDDGSVSMQEDTFFMYLTSGTKDVKLITTTADGCEDSTTQQVVINPLPIASYTVDTVCLGNANTFLNTSVGESSWIWDFGDQTGSLKENPTHLYVWDSSYTVELIVETTFGCRDTVVDTAVVLAQPQASFDVTLACVNQTVGLSSTSQGTPSTWEWNFGDGNMASGSADASHTYGAIGNYMVELIVGNDANCKDTANFDLSVHPVPVAKFSADSVCFGEQTLFTNEATGTTVLSYNYIFGDGNNSYSENPEYIYSDSGSFQAQQIVTNTFGCSDTVAQTVRVKPSPIADFTTDTVCLGLPTTFNDLSTGNPSSWEWDFGDFTPVSHEEPPNVSHTYTSSGQYIASLTVGSNDCVGHKVKKVTVVDAIDVDIYTSDVILCDSAFIVFKNNSSTTQGSFLDWEWTFSNGSVSKQWEPAKRITAGTYMVALSLETDLGCMDTDSIEIEVYPSPSVSFSSENNCTNSLTNFVDSSTVSEGLIYNWYWNFGDGDSSISKNPSNGFADPGTYPVNLTVITDRGCSNSGTKNIQINTPPSSDFTSTEVCLNSTMPFTDMSVDDNNTIIGWEWDFGDGNSSSDQNPKHVYSELSQTFDVRLITTSDVFCSDTLIKTVSVSPIPEFAFGPVLNDGCEGEVISFHDTSAITNAIITNWEWDFGDGANSFLQNPTHTYDEGEYVIRLTLTTSDGCEVSTEATSPLTIHPRPDAGFEADPGEVSIFSPEIAFIDTSINGFSYQWDFGDNESSGEKNPTHFYEEVGTYIVTQIVGSSFGCTDTSRQSVEVKAEFTLYVPNAFTPSTAERNNLFTAKGIGIATFKMLIFDRFGKVIYESNSMEEGWDGKINGKKMPVGVYSYIIEVVDYIGNEHKRLGSVSLLR